MGRYWCKPCEIFIDDNKLARKHHEESQRHKSNIQKSIWKLHQRNRDEESAKREAEKVEREAKKIATAGKVPSFKKMMKRDPLEKKKQDHGDGDGILMKISNSDIGEWEVVQEFKSTNVTQEVESNSSTDKSIVVSTTPRLTKVQTANELENRNWKLSYKTLQPSDDSDEDSTTKIVFKKRKFKKTST